MMSHFSKPGIIVLLISLIHGCTGPSLFSETNAVRSSLFTYDGPAQSVCISGDFNRWSPESHCLRRQKGVWKIQLMLPVGVYRYTFVINGKDWVADPKALFAETDGFGRSNAIAIIE